MEPPKAIFGVVSIRRRLTAHRGGIPTVANPSQCYSILQLQKKRIIKITDNLTVRKSLRLDAPVLKDCESLSDTECKVKTECLYPIVIVAITEVSSNKIVTLNMKLKDSIRNC